MSYEVTDYVSWFLFIFISKEFRKGVKVCGFIDWMIPTADKRGYKIG